MTWSEQEWDGFCALLEEGWPGAFDDATRESWGILLAEVQPAQAVTALKRLLFAGSKFRPSVSELLAEVRRDPSVPSFLEMERLVFGPKGALSAQAPAGKYADQAEMRRAEHLAVISRARDMHPLVASFVHRQGIDRLKSLELGDPTWGEKRRSDLEREWHEHLDKQDGREIAVLASGRREQMERLDPLSALGLNNLRGLELES